MEKKKLQNHFLTELPLFLHMTKEGEAAGLIEVQYMISSSCH